MSGISSASGILAARKALLTAAKTALTAETDIDFYSGWQWPVTQPNWVATTDTNSDMDPRNIGPRRSQDETITFGMSIGAWVPGHTEADIEAAFDRAFEILATIQTYIRMTDITLADTVLWCVPGTTDSDGAVDEQGDGYQVEIATTFVCMHRVRAA
ncbi:hypothetical protein [Microbacterium sp. J1-1]|uniref:hypothetical protein n=1 Tax=Microbacterium sp. J1-1 TaxID=2992441 RepID=UPI002113C224|nr:hypothetical protein [Microbacterium sp. J1-1]UUE19327.1 hypothetical protein LRQ07_10950 [Microbacterium sp. J1-1]